MKNLPPKYSPLHQDHNGSLEKLLDQSGEYELQPEAPEPVQRRSLRHFRPWLIHACILSFNILFFVVQLKGNPEPPTVAACLELTEVYSPAFEAVEYELTKVDGVFDTASPYMGAGPEVDAAWDRLTWNTSNMFSLKPIRLSDEELKLLHKDGRPSNVRFGEEDGGGSMGALNVVHTLHCVDSLRRYIYSDEYPEMQQWRTTRPIFMKYHMDHCIDILRQAIMCNADVGIITYDWVDQFTDPYPDFNLYKKCRKVDKILDWLDKHRLHIDKEHLEPLGNEISLAMPPGATQTPLWEIHKPE